MFDITTAPRARTERGSSIAYRRLKPGPGKTPKAVESDQRDRIHRAMVELVASGGRPAATVRKLTKLAGVSTATFYSLYDGMDECLVSTYVSLMDELRERIAATCTSFSCTRWHDELALRAFLDALLKDPKTARVILIDVYDAGPAAIGSIRKQETLLEAELRQALGRRGREVPPLAAAWVVAGLLHCARQLVEAASRSISSETTSSLIRWAETCLAEPDLRHSSTSPERAMLPTKPRTLVRRPPREGETDLFVSAVLRLSCADGYWKLSVARASRAAGIPATRFKRYFGSLDDAYLLAVDRTARGLFSALASRTTDAVRSWRQVWHEQVASLSACLASTPRVARLVFSGILAPGADGLTRREALIDELAAAWRLSVPAHERPSDLFARASMASLWSAFARTTELGRAEVFGAQARTNAHFFLAPMQEARTGDISTGSIAMAAGT